MKKLLMTALIATLAQSAHADLIGDCKADFKELQIVASRIADGKTGPADVMEMRLEIGVDTHPDYTLSLPKSGIQIPARIFMDVTDETAAYTDFDHRVIHARCNEDRYINSFYLAHEFGHVLAYTYGWDSTEAAANLFGAKVFFEAHKDSTEALRRNDARCAEGKKYFCEWSAYWRQGLLGG